MAAATFSKKKVPNFFLRWPLSKSLKKAIFRLSSFAVATTRPEKRCLMVFLARFAARLAFICGKLPCLSKEWSILWRLLISLTWQREESSNSNWQSKLLTASNSFKFAMIILLFKFNIKNGRIETQKKQTPTLIPACWSKRLRTAAMSRLMQTTSGKSRQLQGVWLPVKVWIFSKITTMVLPVESSLLIRTMLNQNQTIELLNRLNLQKNHPCWTTKISA